MYAFISNEYRTTVNSQRQLDFLLSIYSYPKFKKCDSMVEARQWFAEQDRAFIKNTDIKYGHKDNAAYVSIEYFIADNNVYYNVRTDNFGYIRFYDLPDNVKQSVSYDLIKLKLCNIVLNDVMISHHCIAIENILKILGPYMNVELVLPDISVYLACVKYTGKNFAIRRVKRVIGERLGEVYYKIKYEV